jgi:diguanylate cyclase (GGDEF)-like protein
MKANRQIVVISRDLVLAGAVEIITREISSPLVFRDMRSALDFIYNCNPDLLVVDIAEDCDLNIRLLNDLKNEPIFGQMAVLAILPDDFVIPVWEDFLADDYIRRSMVDSELLKRVELSLFRAERIVEINPLTRLPGNITIMRQIQGRLDRGEKFAVAYADIDFFKPFNDRYGFSRGDEALKMVGRLIQNVVKEQQPRGSFVGHIGGDDFIYVMDIDIIEDTSCRIAGYFDKMVGTLYDMQDRLEKCIHSTDRSGNERTFPLMTISIGITHNRHREFAHYSEIGHVASEMKHVSKEIAGSSVQMDRRKA